MRTASENGTGTNRSIEKSVLGKIRPNAYPVHLQGSLTPSLGVCYTQIAHIAPIIAAGFYSTRLSLRVVAAALPRLTLHSTQ